MNRVDDTSDACARSPARAPFTVKSISDVAPGARLGKSQDTSAGPRAAVMHNVEAQPRAQLQQLGCHMLAGCGAGRGDVHLARPRAHHLRHLLHVAGEKGTMMHTVRSGHVNCAAAANGRRMGLASKMLRDVFMAVHRGLAAPFTWASLGSSEKRASR